MIREKAVWRGQTFVVTWEPGQVCPEGRITQASALCFTADGSVVLVSEDGTEWNLPGGHPEGDERPEQTLAREAWEEACAVVTAPQYLGAQRVEDARGAAVFQTRFWARVELQAFVPRHEIRFRRCAAPSEFLSTLAWGHTPTAAALLEAAVRAEQAFAGSRQAPRPPG